MSDPNVNRTHSLRPFTDDDLAAAQRLSSAFDWPHRIEDWRFVARVGSGFVAEDPSGVIGTALSWKYGDAHASLGMVIVAPEQHGRGIGRALMERLIAGLGERATLLHATPSGQPLYEKLGFHAIGSLDQHQGAAFQPPLVSLPAGERLRPVGANDTPRLVEFASRGCGLDRSAVLPVLLEIADGIALDRDGELLGFGLFRRFGRGYAIGPVVAPDAHRAQALISHWLALHAGMFVRIDTPGDSGLTEWLEGLGLPRVDTVIAMARGAAPPRDPLVRQFGIVNQALG